VVAGFESQSPASAVLRTAQDEAAVHVHLGQPMESSRRLSGVSGRLVKLQVKRKFDDRLAMGPEG
jgi:hypothetical protein